LETHDNQGWQFNLFGIPIPFIGRRESQSGRKLQLLLAIATLVSVAGIVAVATWWAPIQSGRESLWSSFQYTVIAIGIWVVLSGLAIWNRPALISHKANLFLAGFILIPVVAGSLQLSEPHFGGTFGERVIGPTATGGIIRIAGIFALALIVSAPRTTLHLLRQGAAGAQQLGVWIGMRSTEWSQRLGTGVKLLKLGMYSLAHKTWRLAQKAIGQYRRYPIHLILIAWTSAGVTWAFRFVQQRFNRSKPDVDTSTDPVLAYAGFHGRSEGLAVGAPPNLDHESELPIGTSALDNLPPWLQDEEPEDDGDYVPLPGIEDEIDVENDVPFPEVEEAEPAIVESVLSDDTDEEPDIAPITAEFDDIDDDLPGDEPLPVVIDLSSEEVRSGGTISSSKFSWAIPPLDLLNVGEHRVIADEEHQATARLIEQTLSEYNIEVTVKEIRPGPVVTQYGLVPGWVRRYREVKERNPDGSQARGEDGKMISSRVEDKTRVKVDHILAREKDLALALAAPSLRFEAPVPGESFVGLEVPNSRREVVTLRSILESGAFQSLQKKAKLPVALGQGSGGEPVITDLADMPHLLIAGATGSGKSVCMNTIICSLMMQLTPLELQMYLVDPKRVELTAYNGLPHLAGPVLVEADQAVPALHALIAEMQSRYKRFEAQGARNIQGYNAKMSKQEDRIPYLMLVIDELADLMMTSPTDVEYALCRLAQLGRATGIHLVVATQRPSVDVLTGLIKANFPSRASFAVSSQVDSRTILDGAGAEKLLGRGDMLFMATNAAKPKRVQGTYISDEEVDAIVAFWRKQKGTFAPAVKVDLTPAEEDEDTMLQDAQSLAIKHNRISASLLQRKLGIGYAKAASLLDHLEDRGIVGPGDPGKSREVITLG
jgi:S-DNA-T family DNA segregation ATPase FtsK/SpoIIIE